MRTLIRRLVRLSTDKMSPVDGDMSSCIGDVSSCIMVHPRLLYRDVSSHIMSHLVWLMMVCCLDINSRANNCTAIFLFFSLYFYFFLSSRTPSLVPSLSRLRIPVLSLSALAHIGLCAFFVSVGISSCAACGFIVWCLMLGVFYLCKVRLNVNYMYYFK